MENKERITIGITGIALYLIATGLSFGIFTLLGPKKSPGTSDISKTTPTRPNQAHFIIDPNKPRTESCPLNGEKFTSAEKAIWEKRRPIVTMIENHADSRPQSGLSSADVVYEAVAEGGITRFSAVFYCGIAGYDDIRVAPVRSVRMYFIMLASEYGDRPIFMHIGGANDFSGSGDTVSEARALEYLETIGWRVAKGIEFDTFLDTGYPIYIRNPERLDHQVAVEHTMTASLKEVLKEAAKRGWTNIGPSGVAWDTSFTQWKFKDDAKESDRIASFSASFGWGGYNAGYEKDYDVRWEYDKATNIYKRLNGGIAHTDLETKEQLTAKAIIIQYAKEKGPLDKNMHMLYTMTGNGTGLLLQDGTVTKITWSKKDRASRTIFSDANGREVAFNRGKIWIEILPIGSKVLY